MKAILFAVVTTFAASASATDSIFVSTELTRNGEIVDNFSALTTEGVTQPHSNVDLIKYRDSVVKGRVNFVNLAVGAKASIISRMSSNGDIILAVDFDYVKLTKMDTLKVVNFYLDQPKTEGFKLSTSLILASGEKREFKSVENGVEYIYTVSATKR